MSDLSFSDLVIRQIFQWQKAEYEMGDQENAPSKPASPEGNEMTKPSNAITRTNRKE